MRTRVSTKPLQDRAIEELKALLEQSHVIRLKEISREAHSSGCRIDLLARIDIFGHSHTLACAVKRRGPGPTSDDLLRLCEDVERRAGELKPILIAPRVSKDLRRQCAEKKVGFLDFEGNGRLVLGEAFIDKRTLRHAPASHHPARVTGV